jgi:hypothetical protein
VGDLALARAVGSFRNMLARLSRIDVLVIEIGRWRRCPSQSADTEPPCVSMRACEDFSPI